MVCHFLNRGSRRDMVDWHRWQFHVALTNGITLIVIPTGAEGNRVRGHADSGAFPHYPHPLLLRRYFIHYKSIKEQGVNARCHTCDQPSDLTPDQ